ncbi:MAG: DUF1330 domain-containing protein [bacterium]|nr:DUF1330 domain-containing protein [bacterium]
MRPKCMAHETLVGLDITDDPVYQSYREAMIPILTRYGGGFRYDLRVSEVLKSESDAGNINRLFIIYFPDRAAKDAFFSDAEYTQVRKQFFEPSVSAVTILAEYDR